MGRPYTMKEMKQIVEYLIEHRAYGDVRGRKMWVDMANARIIDRTWQSMKETFLKRILPDIHNPYYKLNVAQISSFRQMADVTAKTQNKLEVHEVSDNSNASDNRKMAERQLITKEDEKSGESKCSKIQTRTRSSTDTLVLENCSEGDNEKDTSSDGQKTTKSLRDLITYSEPLTPMLQEVIDDFTSDDDEPALQIVEEPESAPTAAAQNEENNKTVSPETIRESKSYTKTTEATTTANADEISKTQTSKIKSLKLKKTQKGTWENKEPVTSSPIKEKETNNNESEETPNIDKNSTVDTQLPNNQEGLQSHPARVSTESSTSEFVDTRKKKKEKRKRSRSQSSGDHKKKKRDKHRHSEELKTQTKDTQTFNSHPQAANLSKDLVKVIETTNNDAVNQTNMSDDTNIPPNMTAQISREGTSQEAGPSDLNPGNPCLKPASLFAEQFSQSKYSDSENEEPKNEEPKNDSNLIKNDQTEKCNAGEEKSNTNQDKCNGKNEKTDKSIENHEKTDDSHKENEKSDKKNVDSREEMECDGNHVSTSLVIQSKEEIVLLKSHSESDSEEFESPNRIKIRQRALANIFGFSSGVAKKRNNHKFNRANLLRQRNRRRSRNNTFHSIVLESESDSNEENTTASDSRNDRRNLRQGSRVDAVSHKYRKPKPLDMVEDPSDGKLYFVGCSKVYPFVTNTGKSIHYAKISEEQSSKELFWKEKFLKEQKKLAEEKIRADELARLLRQATERQMQAEAEACSPILQPNVSLSSAIAIQKQDKPSATTAAVEKKPEEIVKIKFTKNREIELEGQWPHVTPVFEKMVALFKAQSDAEKSNNSAVVHNVEPEKTALPDATNQETTAQNKVQTSKNDPQTSTTDNVDQQSSKTIDLTEKQNTNKKTNVKHKGKAIQKRLSVTSKRKISSDAEVCRDKSPEVISIDKSSTSEVISSGKSTPVVETQTQVDPETRKKVDKIEGEIFKTIEEIDKSDLSINPNGDISDHITTRKRGRPMKVSSSLSTTSAESLPKKGRTRSVSQAQSALEDNTGKPAEVMEKDEIAEKPEKEEKKLALRSKNALKLVEQEDTNVKRNTRAPKRYSSDTGIATKRKARAGSRASLRDNTEDLDDDSIRYMLPPARGPNTRLYTHQLTIPPLDSSRMSESTQGYQESNPNPPKVTVRKKKKLGTVGLLNKNQISKVRRKSSPYLADDDSTNDAPAQKSGDNASLDSEVYKSESYQLLMPKIRTVTQMDKIDESPVQNTTGSTNKNLENLTNLTVEVNNELYVPSNERGNDLLLRSSEGNSSNFSLPHSPELSIVENLTVSREILRSSPEHPCINEIQANDSSQPTDCNKYVISAVDVSMPLMQQECEVHSTVSLDRSVTLGERMSLNAVERTDESLEKKLRDLLLESAKKIAEGNMQYLIPENMDIDKTTVNKNKSKRRSSTPRKKTSLRLSNTLKIGPVLEEHTESCSHSGRKSCPPIINVIPCGEDAIDNNNKVKGKGSKGRKKKDVIRVKISRPRRRSTTDKAFKRVSVCNDSGINDTVSTGSECKVCCNESTELIHNHSDTCIHDDCVGDSVEFIENENSIISLTSSLPSGSNSQSKLASEDFVTPESFCSNAQDAIKFTNASVPTSVQSSDGDTATVYLTPPDRTSFESIMTDDLSDDPPSPPRNNWYLLSETNTNSVDTRCQNKGSVGSNLHQIFPLTCAVPDLSTISEMSKENEMKNTVMSPDSQMDTFSETVELEL